MPKLEDWEIKKYWEIFSGLGPEKNKLSGDRVSVVFKNSHLSSGELASIWDLSDIDTDGFLDFEEFCIAMRLIFDRVNGNISVLPSILPDWLVPASKSHLVQADRAVNGSASNNVVSDDDDEAVSLSSDFDWYISPTDKSTYETVYAASSDRYGRIKFESLNDLYKTLSVPETDISSAWNLVNPKSAETIDKDQTLVFLHILNQRSNGRRVPRGVPASLRATFSKEVPEYNLDSHQADVARPVVKKGESFADSYLNKLGVGSRTSTSSGTDFSATKGTDWEEVRLRRQLADIDALIKKAEKASQNPTPEDDKLAMTKYEFEQLLKYKEEQAKGVNVNSGDLSGVESDINLIESQVIGLEQYLEKKRNTLKELQAEIASAKA
ncbi:unnamed protein product [Kuraishia capsulata CBS 1993]|uniref:Actin cytoskeleton-regulatory complex protein END3 n=1 Tax=Kuraishia capsulata CBS 1993 TaxID=1382522 RepID=W6MMA4_9ASCO|nr:uncharacterized protein KUCA_T00001988001 [Kuraishia capsulata CBS 1993]CDK26017.1 unnamed protein product [Kuraishia capsulata CBS 1993]